LDRQQAASAAADCLFTERDFCKSLTAAILLKISPAATCFNHNIFCSNSNGTCVALYSSLPVPLAQAAPYMMARHPQLQLVVVGPTGDAVGAAASAALAELSRQYPDRMYCPQVSCRGSLLHTQYESVQLWCHCSGPTCCPAITFRFL
jgi:hypothetical protein